MESKAVEVLATVTTIIGFYLLSEHLMVPGFLISLSANALWLVWGFFNKANGIMIVNACLAVSSINGIIG